MTVPEAALETDSKSEASTDFAEAVAWWTAEGCLHE